MYPGLLDMLLAFLMARKRFLAVGAVVAGMPCVASSNGMFLASRPSLNFLLALVTPASDAHWGLGGDRGQEMV